MERYERIKAILNDNEKEMALKKGIVYLVDLNSSRIIMEHSPKIKVYLGCERWGTHVWGVKAYSIGDGCEGEVPIIVLDDSPSYIHQDERGWKIILHGINPSESIPKPWSPLSIMVRGDKDVRKGVLWIVGSPTPL